MHARVLLVLALLALPVAVAAETAPVLVERVEPGALVADVDSPAVARFTLLNLNPSDGFYVSVQAAEAEGWTVSVEAPGDLDAGAGAEFFLDPGNESRPEPLEVDVRFAPTEPPRADQAFEVAFSLVHRRSGDVTRLVETVDVVSGAPPRILGVFPNTLPAPLDNVYGSFAAEMLVWIALAVLAIFAGDALVRALTARASSAVTKEILTKLRRPLFLFVVLLGVSHSFAILPRNLFTDIIAKTFLAIAVGVFGLYVLYRVLDSALLYYEREIGPRTRTKMDDLLVPVIRKMGVVVLWVAGVILTLRTLGWDPTLIFAGAGIAGLVIAFAAQDTFSNLFSGLFLMLDQPFREGDEITLETGDTARVASIGLRTTRLYNPRAHESIIVPNNQLATRRIVNHHGPDRRHWITIDVGASYDSNPQHVARTLLRVAREHPRVLKDNDWTPLVVMKAFGESSLDFTLRAPIVEFAERNLIASELRFAIKAAFDAEGIEIPYPQRVLHVKDGRAPPVR